MTVEVVEVVLDGALDDVVMDSVDGAVLEDTGLLLMLLVDEVEKILLVSMIDENVEDDSPVVELSNVSVWLPAAVVVEAVVVDVLEANVDTDVLPELVVALENGTVCDEADKDCEVVVRRLEEDVDDVDVLDSTTSQSVPLYPEGHRHLVSPALNPELLISTADPMSSVTQTPPF